MTSGGLCCRMWKSGIRGIHAFKGEFCSSLLFFASTFILRLDSHASGWSFRAWAGVLPTAGFVVHAHNVPLTKEFRIWQAWQMKRLHIRSLVLSLLYRVDGKLSRPCITTQLIFFWVTDISEQLPSSFWFEYETLCGIHPGINPTTITAMKFAWPYILLPYSSRWHFQPGLTVRYVVYQGATFR